METKVKEPCPSYDMYSQRGNRKCHTLVKRISKKILTSKKYFTNKEIEGWIREGMNKIKEKHGEVWDTEPRNIIVGRINEVVQQRYGRGEDLDNYL